MHHKECLERIDVECLAIYRSLFSLSEHLSVSRCIWDNPIAICFHELIRFFTTVVIRRIELDFDLARADLLSIDAGRFPFVSYKNVNDLFALEGVFFSRPSSDLIRKCVQKSKVQRITNACAGIVSTLGKRKCVGLAPSSVSSFGFVVRMLMDGRNVRWLTGACFERDKGPRCEGLIDSLVHELVLNSSFLYEEDAKPLIRMASKILELGTIEESLSHEGLECLLLGSMSTIQNRLLSASAIKLGIPVISVTHGEADGLLDEPIFGYGERSFSDVLISYGCRQIRSQDSLFLNPVGGGDPVIVQSNSDVVLNSYKPDEVPALSLNTMKILYVPTLYSGFDTYGPFRTISDRSYATFRRHLVDVFPGLKIKCHPKGDGNYSDGVDECNRIYGALAVALKEFDAYIFDYISTAFVEAAATSKPIIFLDLGIRNLTDQARLMLQSRCMLVTLDEIEDQDLLDKILAINGVRSNSEVAGFSLIESQSTRADTVIETINSVLG